MQIGCGDKNQNKICGCEWKKKCKWSEEEIVGDKRKLATVSFVWLECSNQTRELMLAMCGDWIYGCLCMSVHVCMCLLRLWLTGAVSDCFLTSKNGNSRKKMSKIETKDEWFAQLIHLTKGNNDSNNNIRSCRGGGGARSVFNTWMEKISAPLFYFKFLVLRHWYHFTKYLFTFSQASYLREVIVHLFFYVYLYVFIHHCNP